MSTLLEFIIIITVLSIAVAGFEKLIRVAIAPGEIFGRWQKVLSKLEKNSRKKKPKFFWEFLHKSLGGCDTCTRQRIAEMTYVTLFILYYAHYDGWKGWVTYPVFHWIYETSAVLAWTVAILQNVLLYGLFCGLVIYVGQMLNYEKKQAQAAEEIIEQTPKRKS